MQQRPESMPPFQQAQLEAIANALADTADGLTGTQIGHLLSVCRLPDPTPALAKRHRLFNAFAEAQNAARDGDPILRFIREAVNPARFLGNSDSYEKLRENLNRALALVGLAVTADGKVGHVPRVMTIADAEQRAAALRDGLTRRGVHPDVLRFCRSELLVDNYFHAVLEAVKSVADKIRQKTGLEDDGSTLVERALGGDIPMLAINPLRTKSERSEQRGFANLLRGIVEMFRNPTAHEARINWSMTKEDAEDLLSLVSLIHRRLDRSHMPPRV